MGQIRGFFRSDFSAFGTGAPNALKSDLKKPRICPIWGQSDPLWSQTYHPWLAMPRHTRKSSTQSCVWSWVNRDNLITVWFIITIITCLPTHFCYLLHFYVKVSVLFTSFWKQLFSLHVLIMVWIIYSGLLYADGKLIKQNLWQSYLNYLFFLFFFI